jgi:SagB-type dehydrogenase family enzyme
LRAPAKKRSRIPPPILCARLGSHVRLETDGTGRVVASFNGYPVSLGAFSSGLVGRLHDLRTGVPLASFAGAKRKNERELDLLMRRLAQRGLLEYCFRRTPSGEDLIVIEPQTADYWPEPVQLHNADVIALSRFAYMRRRGNEMVIESPRAAALFRFCNPSIAANIAALSAPQSIKRLAQERTFLGIELLALLVDCQILFKTSENSGLRQNEGDHNLVLWDFHDLLFHARSTEGRQANPLGGIYPHIGIAPALPAVRPPWAGKKIDLRNLSAAANENSSFTRLLHERHSTRVFNSERPITIAELSRFLESTARVLSTRATEAEEGPSVTYTARPYPSAGAAYELELYLAVGECERLARGFYHYDAAEHTLAAITVGSPEFEALLTQAQFAMDAPASPQILIVIAARFGRMSWKYSGLAYALILKDVGVLTQTFYLMATDMELGGCAIGIVNIDLFAKMTGIEFHIEGPVGQFALGRRSASNDSS